MKTYFLTFLLLGLGSYLGAQNRGLAYTYSITPSEPVAPEDKETAVVSEVLRKLIHQEFNHGDTAINTKQIKGSYLQGSGVLFSISQYMPFYSNPMVLGVNGRAVSPSRYRLTTTSGQLADVEVLGTARPEGSRTKKAQQPTNIAGQQLLDAVVVPNVDLIGDSVSWQVVDGQTVYTSDGSVVLNQNRYSKARTSKVQDSVFSAKIPRMKKVLEKFLAEYTILLNKVKPEEKIWVTWTFKEDLWGVEPMGKNICELSAKITKQDMLDLRAGKIDQAKFGERIQYTITQCATPQVANPEIEVFAAILNSLYSAEVSQNLVAYPSVKGSIVGNFGYNFTLELMPKAASFSDLEVDPATGKFKTKVPQDNAQEEIDNKVKAFKTEFPGQLLEYGRILKGLKTGEILKVDVSVGGSRGLFLPGAEVSQWSYTIPQSLIRDYDTGKLKLEDAVKLIQIEEKK